MKPRTRFILLLCKLCLSIAASNPLQAQAAPSGSVASLSEWQTSGETNLTGTILEVISKPDEGAPQGLTLRLSSALGVAHVNLGSRLNDTVKHNLTQGRVVQVTGAMRQIGETKYLLVRELVLDPEDTAQKIVVRNAKGFPTRQATASGNRSRRMDAGIGGGQ